MIDKLQGASTHPLGSGPIKQAPPPPPPPPEAKKKEEADKVALSPSSGKKSKAELPNNPLDKSVGRTAADVTSGASGAAEVAKDTRGIASTAAALGSRFSWLGRLGSSVSTGLTKVADWGDDIAARAPKVGKAFVGFAKAAPFIGLGMAALDIGKAAIEQDPEKKQKAKGQAALSTISGVAGVAGAAMLATPLAPVGVACLAVGVGATVLSMADTFFFDGKVSTAIGGAVDAVGSAAKAVGEGVSNAAKAVGDGAKKVWGAITSL